MLALAAFLCFAAATIWFTISRAWPMTLVSAGLTLQALDSVGPFRIG